MKKDLSCRSDIEKLVNFFFKKLKEDKFLGDYFSHPDIDETQFVAKMYSFWENVIFYTGNYEGHPMETHKKLHEKNPLTKNHFKKYLDIFSETVDEFFEGENAQIIKVKANNIGVVMQIKIL
ncbi:MAG TPA: group III truncated hemoglobin [Niabella sp.]|jgi:hemoglobin|nr:group III truncated hemoglobin [Chitinophagaceae bacterium]HRN47587.1 group III truncated hemoglobin [Niabella sp.]HRO83362.1 group III truncated hemoglobin [Niabella sp.]HUN01960.1 group III truncated hemoglobin [Niabella sp.]